MIHYKKLTTSDLDHLKNLNVLFSNAFEDPETHLSKIPRDEYLTSLLSKDNFIVIVAFHESIIVGGLVAYVLDKYEQERSEVYIYDLAVDNHFRRQGIATGLINNLKYVAKTFGAWVIFVQADRADIPAIALYDSMGVREEPLHFDIPINESKSDA